MIPVFPSSTCMLSFSFLLPLYSGCLKKLVKTHSWFSAFVVYHWIQVLSQPIKLLYGPVLGITKTEWLDISKLFDAVVRSLSAYPRLFDASKRDFWRRNHRLVYSHHPHFQLFTDSPRLGQIVGEEVAGESSRSVVGLYQNILLCWKPKK